MDLHLDLADIWRQLNAVLALVTLVLIVRWFRWRAYFNSQERAFIHGGMASSVATFFGSVHAVLNDFGFSIGIPLATCALPFFIYATLKKPDRIDNPLNQPRPKEPM